MNRRKYVKENVTVLALATLMPAFIFAKNGLMVSFRSGLPLAGTSIGFKIGPFAPYAGIDIAMISADYTDDDTEWDRDYNSGIWYKDYEYHTSFSGSARLFMPQVGARFYLTDKTLKSYLKGEFLLVIPIISGHEKGSEVEYNPDGSVDWMDTWDNDLSKSEEEAINDALDMWGAALGFGMEYAFNGHFTVGGEFGLRYFGNDVQAKDEDEDTWDGQVQWRDKWKSTVSATLGFTYTNFFLNFYF